MSDGAFQCSSFRERPERERREVGEGDQDQGDAGDHADEQRPVGGQRAVRRRRRALPRQRAGERRARRSSAGTGRTSIASPSAVLYQSVLTVMPANAEPLLLAAEVNAYSTSESPCGAGVEHARRVRRASAIAIAVPTSTISGVIRK